MKIIYARKLICRLFGLILLVFYIQGCLVVKKKHFGLAVEELRMGQIEKGEGCVPIKRANENVVVLSFFEEFNDSVIVYANGKKIAGYYLVPDVELVSSGYSGVDCVMYLKSERNNICIELVDQKKCVFFDIDKKKPLYSIQRYGNVWYVNGRECVMTVK